MSDTMASLRRKIASAGDLQSVVRTMKALAASSIGQYEESVLALGDYYRTVQLGLGAYFRAEGAALIASDQVGRPARTVVGAVVFGSDQGLVGQFNEVVADFAIDSLADFPGEKRVWAVGERVNARLIDAGVPPMAVFAVPGSVRTIGPLVGEILMETEAHASPEVVAELHLFYNRPKSASIYVPFTQRLLPLDSGWGLELLEVPWPTGRLPEILGGDTATLRALIREYLFISLFRACAESLASENASRLSAMQRADRNIDDMLENLNRSFHRLRQSSIDEELFDVISGVEALSKTRAAANTDTHCTGMSGH